MDRRDADSVRVFIDRADVDDESCASCSRAPSSHA